MLLRSAVQADGGAVWALGRVCMFVDVHWCLLGLRGVLGAGGALVAGLAGPGLSVDGGARAGGGEVAAAFRALREQHMAIVTLRHLCLYQYMYR